MILISQLVRQMKDNGFNIKQNIFFHWLRENGYLKKVTIGGSEFNIPTQYAMEHNLLKMRKLKLKNNREAITPLVTKEGQKYFIESFRNRI